MIEEQKSPEKPAVIVRPENFKAFKPAWETFMADWVSIFHSRYLRPAEEELTQL